MAGLAWLGLAYLALLIGVLAWPLLICLFWLHLVLFDFGFTWLIGLFWVIMVIMRFMFVDWLQWFIMLIWLIWLINWNSLTRNSLTSLPAY